MRLMYEELVGTMPPSEWDRPEDRAEVGGRLRLLEQIANRNGVEMAEDLGVKNATWHNWKMGEKRLPTGVGAVLKRRFGCSLDWLYLGDESDNKPGFTAKLRDAEKKGPPQRGRGRRPSNRERENGQ
jgi:hypothetical protein